MQYRHSCFGAEIFYRRNGAERRSDRILQGQDPADFDPAKAEKILLAYAQQNHISSGILFRTRSGKPINRCSVWAAMKRLCARARVRREKVFPHNLRKLFARTFYRVEKDLAKLADLLGHSSIDTTRIYIMSTCKEHQRKIDVLGLVL